MPREQIVLISRTLDEWLPAYHIVRTIEAILRDLDWSAFEAEYHDRTGQPAIHPRVLTSVILYGHMCRISSSRRLEEAIGVRTDFVWLTEGRTIDHSTICGFRLRFGKYLGELGAQMALIAHQMGVTTLQHMAFDGTRMRANNRRSRTAEVEKLDELERRFQEQIETLEREAREKDTADNEQSAAAKSRKTLARLASKKNRLEAIRKAKEEIDRARAAGEAIPKSVPLTDPQSRIMPNKSGGYDPNFNPTTLVDMEGGFILDAEVIAGNDEEHHLVPAIERAEERLRNAGEEVHIETVAGDSKFVCGPNIEQLEARDTELIGPIDQMPDFVNRSNPSVPISAEHYAELPTRVIKKATKTEPALVQLTNQAFVFNEATNCYWCPQGKTLAYTGTSRESKGRQGRTLERQRFAADASDCAGCPLRNKCLQPKSTHRTLSRDQTEDARERLRTRMQKPEKQAVLSSRSTEGERPFAVIKDQFGVRRFLLRGLERVRSEWNWLTGALNLRLLAGYVPRGDATKISGARGSPDLALARDVSVPVI